MENEKESLTSKILFPLGVLGFITFFTAFMMWEGKRYVKKQTHYHAQKIGIYNQINNIERVSRPEDYNGDGWLDYVVQFKDGKTIMYYHKGYERRNKDLSNKLYWSHMNFVWFKEGIDANQL